MLLRIRIVLLVLLSLSIMVMVDPAQAQILDQETATVCMSVDVRASVTGLDNITLTAQGKDGAAGTLYLGSDEFTLEANAPVQIEVNGIRLSNGPSVLDTSFEIDGQGSSLITGETGTYIGTHSITARATLGSISEQLAGEYSATIVVTVVPLVAAIEVCEEIAVEIAPVVIDTGEEQLADMSTASSDTTDEASNDELYKQIFHSIPSELRGLLNSGKQLEEFPYLAEFLLWREDISQPLSDEARFWWMFHQ